MKLLITGAAGFLGKHAVKAAMARGWDVDSFDIQNIPANRCADVRMLLRIEADCVLHLAGFASNADFAVNMAENYANNVFGPCNVLLLAQQSGARVLYASSSAVYGNTCDDPDGVNGEYDPIDATEVNSHYAKSKLMCEMLAESFATIGLKALGLRIFNAYGPGDEKKPHPSPITQMIAAKRAAAPFTCYGDGTQAKDFIHVSDVVEIIIRLIESDYEAATGVVNIGTGVATNFNTLAELIGVPLEYAPVPDPASYQYFTRASTERLESIIGRYECKSVREGIEGLL